MRRVGSMILLCGVALAASGCVVDTAPYPPIPAPRVEVVPPAPGPRLAWEPGHWRWNGSAYLWVPGHYVEGRVGVHWIDGHWANRAGAWVWVPGHWS